MYYIIILSDIICICWQFFFVFFLFKILLKLLYIFYCIISTIYLVLIGETDS